MSDVFSTSPVRSGSGKNLEGSEFIIFTSNLYGIRQLLPCSSAEGQRHQFSDGVLSMASSEQSVEHLAPLCTNYTQMVHSEPPQGKIQQEYA